MPWFRWLKKQPHTAAEAHDTLAALPLADSPDPDEGRASVETLVSPPTDSETPSDSAEVAAAKRRRRRGSRGGRGRSGAGASGAATAQNGESARDDDLVVDKAEKAEKTDKTDKGAQRDAARDGRDRRRGASQQAQRRRQPPRRAPLPSAKRELLIAHDIGEQRVAILEDDKVAEVYLERPESRSIVGNIYLGTVDNVLPGMEAAFVEIGLEKNGFLYVDEIVVPELEGKRHGKKIQDLISRGEQLLVQAVKDPMKTKGARLTTEISLPGRFLVFVPNGEGLGVSRRLDDAERSRLKDILKAIAPEEGGVIVRTAAEGASAEDVERDLVFLQRLWKTIQSRADGAKAPDLVYQEAELPLRIVRDLFAGDFIAAYVDNERTHKRIVGYLKKTSPHMVERVHRWKEKPGLFEQYGVEKEIASTLDRRVDLPSGGYLIFDYAEAFTVIDVNTGRFVGSRSKTSTQRLEDTIVKNNLEAVKEVVRQLRLRDIGGIIVIDFIDMANPKNRQAVEEALRTELERDRTKTYVVEISPLGLVEMTRQNVTDGPREVMTRKCQVCGGDGIVVSDQTQALRVERRLRALAASGSGTRVQAYRVAVHPRTLALLAGPGGERLAAIEDATRRRFYLVGAEGHVHTDHLEVLAEGKIDDLKPASSLEEGAEVEVKLVELGLHDPATGAGKVGDTDVIVAEAAKLVGRKAKVRIGRVLDGVAYAALVADEAVIDPITFESEAEKPTRAPAKRKTASAGTAAPADDLALSDELDEEAEPGEDGEEGDEAGDGTTPTAKKRTRRGSRGGRRRKKKPTDGDATTAAEAGDEIDGDSTELDAELGAQDADGDSASPAPARRAGSGGARAGRKPTGEADRAEATSGEVGDEPTAGARAPRQRRTPRIHVPDADRTDGESDTEATPKPPRSRSRNTRAKAPAKAASLAGVEEVTDVAETLAADLAAPGDGISALAEAAREAVLDPIDGGAEPNTDAESDAAAGSSDGAGPDVETDGTAVAVPKKRTRRGSRGGRNRKKKVAPATLGGADGAEASADSADSADYADSADGAVDSADTADARAEPDDALEPVLVLEEPTEFQPRAAKPPARSRATRPPVEASDNASVAADHALLTADAADAPSFALDTPATVAASGSLGTAARAEDGADGAASPPEEASATGDGYVPMSEWIDDFEQSRRRPTGP